MRVRDGSRGRATYPNVRQLFELEDLYTIRKQITDFLRKIRHVAEQSVFFNYKPFYYFINDFYDCLYSKSFESQSVQSFGLH